MRYLGKIIGALAGLRFGATGVAIGAALGHIFDSGVVRAKLSFGSDIMGETLFALMGFIARADGQVSPREVAFGEQLFDQFGLEGAARTAAVARFNVGRSDSFHPQPVLQRFVAQFGMRSAQAEHLLAALIAIAYSDGVLIAKVRSELKLVAIALGFREDELNRELERFRPAEAAPESPEETLEHAYAVLGITADADAAAIKLAYRKLISQYHPDKLEGAGIRGDALKGAQAKAKAVRSAYERLSAPR
jgi:DnaJ like chaperone protein